MQRLGDILKTFNPVEDKYISREFQKYGIYLAETLGDYEHKALYIRLAKTVPRAILEKTLTFVKDANAKSRGRLFMWKMKELRKAAAEVEKTRVPNKRP
jgi:hypothetical protein